MNARNFRYEPLIVLGSLILFLPFLGSVHLFDWDEINFAEAAREMLATKDYFHVQINYQPFWEKPPLFIWMQALSMKLFGINEFAARFPNAICGVITLLMAYRIGKKFYNEKFGILWAFAFGGSVLPFLYFKSGIIDPWFNLFTFLAIYFFACLTSTSSVYPRSYNVIFSALFLGLAVLTKGPVAVLIAMLCFLVFIILNRFRKVISVWEFILYILVTATVCLAWFGVELVKNGPWFLQEFITYQVRLFRTEDAGHGGPFYYHFLVLLFGCFPASVFAIRGMVKRGSEVEMQRNFRNWMLILFWVVLILFSIVKTKIVHYSSLCYFPLTYLAAYTIYYLSERNFRWNKGLTWGLILIGDILCIALALLPFLLWKKEMLLPYLHDPFARASLEGTINLTGFEALGSIVLAGTIFFAFRFFKREKYSRGARILFAGVALSAMLIMITLVPAIEALSQGPAINFYKEKRGEDCHVEVLDFKSYAHLFYFQKPPVAEPRSYDKRWLIKEQTEKPAYFVTKVNLLQNLLDQYPELKVIRKEKGFVFLTSSVSSKQ